MATRYTVIVSPRVVARLAEQADYIAYHSTATVADAYISKLFTYFDGLDMFPERGHRRTTYCQGFGSSATATPPTSLL